MTALNIDTLKFARRLKEAGADEKLAEAIAEGISEMDTSRLATKDDIHTLKTEMAELKAEMVRMHLLTALGIVAATFTMLRFFD